MSAGDVGDLPVEHVQAVIMTATRTETDSFGPLEVPADKYWGAQTQRSIMNFPIGWEKQPVAVVRALGVIKQACARRTRRPARWTRKLGPMRSSRPRAR
jgi:fumarate hydratase class II